MRRNPFLVIVLLALTNITFAQKDARSSISSSSDSTVKVIRKDNEPIKVIIQESKDKPDKSGKVSEANAEVLDVIIEFKESALFAKRQQRVATRKSDYSARFATLENDLRGIHQRMARGSAGAAPAIRKRYYKTFHGVNVSIRKDSYAEIAALPYVKSIYPNETVQAYLNESVPLIHANQVWTQLGAQGEGMVVGIIDTGIDYHHPDLGNGFGPSFKVIGGYDFVNNDADPMDDNKHGTHCAGIVAADGVLKGVAPKAKLVALKALNSQGKGTWDNIIAAIEWTSDPNNDDNDSDHLQIVSMSLGGPGNANDPVSTAVDNAAALGTIFCIAAGNDGEYSMIGSPGTARQAITVGATDMADNMSPTSSKGPNLVLQSIKPEVVAPGVSIYSTVLNGGYENQSGTSMATPHVAGLVALLKQLHPTWSPEQIKSALVTTAKILATPDVMAHGGGRIESLKAAQVTSFAVPSVLSFGSIDVTQPVYTATQQITVSNEHTSTQVYTAAAGTTAPGVGMTLSPTAFSLAPGQSRIVTVTLTVDNAAVPYKPGSFAYDGFITITGTKDALHVPWAFTKVTRLHLDFDVPSPQFYLSNGTTSFDFNSARFAADGLSATIDVPAGTYVAVIHYLRDATAVKFVAKEDIAVTGFHTINVPSTLAKNRITFAPVNELGAPITPDRASFFLRSPKGRNTNMGYVAQQIFGDIWLSDLSENFSLLFFNLVGTSPEQNQYAIQYPRVNGLTTSKTLTVEPTAYTGRDVTLHLGTESNTRNIQTYLHIWFGEIYFGIGKNFDWPGIDVWQGKVFVTKDTHPEVRYAMSIGSGDTDLNYTVGHFSTKEFAISDEKLGTYQVSPPRPDIFLAEEGQRLVFGSGAIFPTQRAPTYTWDIGFSGQLEDTRRNLRPTTSYTVYNAGGTPVSTGPLTSLSSSAIQPAYNKIVYAVDGFNVGGVAGHGTLTKIFNYQGLQRTPEITSLQIRNHQHVPVEKLENGAANSIRFSIDDQQLTQSSVKLYIKASGTDTWQELSTSLIAQTTYGLQDPCGDLYKADFEQLPFPVGTVDLKINAADAQGNSIEWILEPAFVLEDNNKAPVITGQQSVATAVNLARTINFADLVVQDVDNAYPTGFSLKVFLGSNYTLQGNTITPSPGYGGMLSVPVRVNDGLENSNIYNVQVSVGTGLSLDSLALVQLYHTAGGDNWTNKTNWLTGRLSTWYGVSVVGGRVARLQMHQNNLVGTADFTFGLDKLSYLELNDNNLTRVDVSSTKGLEYLIVQRNPITTLVTNATPDYYNKLKSLDARYSDLSTADISNMPALQLAYFDGSYTTTAPQPRLTQLVTNHTPQYYPGLTRLIMQNCAVPTVDLSGMPALLRLDAVNGALTSLDISTNTALEYLILLNNPLLSLNIDSHPALKTVDARTNKIVSFVTNESANYYHALSVLRLTRNDVDHVDISNMPALETVEMGVASGAGIVENSNLTEVVINTADNYYPKLTLLQIQYTAITSLDVRNMKSLVTLNCPHNHLTSLNTTGLTKLKTLGVSYNQLTELNISECPDIETVTAQINQITNFVTNQTPDYYGALKLISIERNYIPGLDIRNMPALETFTAGDVPGGSSTISTQFTTVLTNTAPNYYPVLGRIAVAYTMLSALDVRNMPALYSLSVNRGALSSIDLTHNPALTSIVLQYNQLTNIQMNAPAFYPALATLNINGNKLTFDYLEPHMGKPYALTYVIQTPVVNAPYTENVVPGGSFTLTTVTPGTSNLYQWQRKASPTSAWVAVAGETAATLTRSNATTANAGIYRCLVTSTLVTGVTLYRQEITITVQAAASSARLMAEVAEEGSENISVYPVPANDQLTVNIGNAGEAIIVDLTNSAGVVVGQIQAPRGNVSIDTRDIASGIYFVKIKTAGALVVRKVAIIH